MTELPKPLREVAAELAVSPRWLRELIHKESIPVLKRGRLIWFDRQAIDLLVEALRCPSKSPAENPPTPSRYRGRSQDNDFDAVLRLTAPASREKKQRPEAGRKR